MRITCILFALLLSVVSIAQQSTPKDLPAHIILVINEIEPQPSYDRILANELQRSLKPEVKITQAALYTLTIAYDLPKAKVIEGMETVTYTDVDITGTILNNLTGDLIWEDNRTITGKGDNYKVAMNSAFRKYANHKHVGEAIQTAVKNSMSSDLMENCASTLDQINTNGSEEELSVSLLAIEYLMDSDCADNAVKMANEIYATIDKRLCETQLPQFEILVKSGEYNRSKMVSQLLQFSPNAPCHEQVIELAELIGKQRLNSAEKEAVQNYIHISIDQDNIHRLRRYRDVKWNYN